MSSELPPGRALPRSADREHPLGHPEPDAGAQSPHPDQIVGRARSHPVLRKRLGKLDRLAMAYSEVMDDPTLSGKDREVVAGKIEARINSEVSGAKLAPHLREQWCAVMGALGYLPGAPPPPEEADVTVPTSPPPPPAPQEPTAAQKKQQAMAEAFGEDGNVAVPTEGTLVRGKPALDPLAEMKERWIKGGQPVPTDRGSVLDRSIRRRPDQKKATDQTPPVAPVVVKEPTSHKGGGRPSCPHPKKEEIINRCLNLQAEGRTWAEIYPLINGEFGTTYESGRSGTLQLWVREWRRCRQNSPSAAESDSV